MTDFLRTLRLNLEAGVGVIAVRTRDPMSTAFEVSNFCSAVQRPIRHWDCVRGWIMGDDPIEGKSAGDNHSTNLLHCFTKILSPDTDEGKMPEKGIFCFVNPHLFIKQKDPHPPLVQLLTNMAHTLPSQNRRVILTVTPGFTFPPELQELIPVIDNEPPTVEELCDSAEQIMQDTRVNHERLITRFDSNEMLRIAQAGAGMILPEFESSLARVLQSSVDRREKTEAESVRRALLREKALMVSRNRSLEVMSPVNPDAVGGLDVLKKWISTRVLAMQPEAWEQGVDKPKGVALVGPPGTGKSLCGKMVGSVLGVATIRFDISSVFSGLVGSSEENMREALFLIEGMAPCVVLIDEVDKAISVNSGGDGGTSQKVLGTLLTFMQETKKPIFWMLTMNRTDNIPAELLRAGRLDQVFGVTVPHAGERREIFEHHLRARQVDPAKLDLRPIIDATEDFIGAEIEAIVSEARLTAYNEGKDVTIQHLRDARDSIKPLAKKMAAQFAAMREWCETHATAASTPQSAAVIPDAADGPRRRTRARLN